MLSKMMHVFPNDADPLNHHSKTHGGLISSCIRHNSHSPISFQYESVIAYMTRFLFHVKGNLPRLVLSIPYFLLSSQTIIKILI